MFPITSSHSDLERKHKTSQNGKQDCSINNLFHFIVHNVYFPHELMEILVQRHIQGIRIRSASRRLDIEIQLQTRYHINCPTKEMQKCLQIWFVLLTWAVWGRGILSHAPHSFKSFSFLRMHPSTCRQYLLLPFGGTFLRIFFFFLKKGSSYF